MEAAALQARDLDLGNAQNAGGLLLGQAFEEAKQYGLTFALRQGIDGVAERQVLHQGGLRFFRAQGGLQREALGGLLLEGFRRDERQVDGRDLLGGEAGLGGETDASNVIKNTVCAAFATISVDHLGVIGDTLEEIAQTKSGIIKPGCTVVSARQQENVRLILRKKAESLNCIYTEAEPEQMSIEKEDYKGLTFSYKKYTHMQNHIAGECQRENLSVALEVIESLRKLGYQIEEEAVRDGLDATRWAGRFTCLSEDPVVIVDGAHNEDAAKKLKTSIERYFTGKELILIMGVFKDKEYEKIVQILCPLAKRVYTVDLPNKERTLPAEKLAECVRDCMTEQLSVYAEKSIGDAVAKAYTYATEDSGKRAVIACGSLSYLSEVIRCMEGCVQNPQRKERI